MASKIRNGRAPTAPDGRDKSPKTSERRVALLAYPGAQVLDVTGPAAVFSGANRECGERLYEVLVVSSAGGTLPTNGDVGIASQAVSAIAPSSVDTFLVSGGGEQGVRGAMGDDALRRWVLRVAKTARRWGSVCSGTFVLAAYGLLDGKRVATHWEVTERLARGFPKLSVDADALYVVDGATWTSAGVTTGIDMALAMVEHDHGSSLAAAVARRLVLYGRRPGFQSQFSPLLRAQLGGDAPFARLVEWIRNRLGEPLGVTELARHAGQSPRDFHRKFVQATGKTPARFVEELRLDSARALLPHGLSLKEVATETGFGSAVRMSRAFERRFGVKPSFFREHERGAAERAGFASSAE
jgi:transcriptional regulator GlxA family with amidase domain